MKKYRYLSYIFAILAILMSNVMCASVAYSYCNMQWGIKYSLLQRPCKRCFSANYSLCGWDFHLRCLSLDFQQKES